MDDRYLEDKEFLLQLDNLKVKELLIKIIVLSFDENPIKEIQGVATGGNISLDGNSAIRRSLSLSMYAQKKWNDLTNVNNLISMNKKIKVYAGIKNPFPKYDKIIWFPLGLYIIDSATIQSSISGSTISITGKDKMCTLDGSIGQGKLPFNTRFDKDETMSISVPLVTIIRTLLQYYGKEKSSNIIINDVDKYASQFCKYVGTDPLYIVLKENNEYTYTTVKPTEYYLEILKDEHAGYLSTAFTYPEELTFKADTSVMTVLNTIKDFFGNYEFFYNLEGKFVFQQIKNYLNISNTPIYELNGTQYIKYFNENKYLYDFSNNTNITSIGKNPNYQNIYNDFRVIGISETDGIQKNIIYHLAIDTKPQIYYAKQYMWYSKDAEIPYIFTLDNKAPAIDYELISTPCDEWREELYRQALIASSNGTYGNEYQEELLAFWREIFNPMTGGWSKTVTENPENLTYWLDFIDDTPNIGQYSINNIGKRSKNIEVQKLKIMFSPNVPDITFVLQSDAEAIAQYKSSGTKFCIIPDDQNFIDTVSYGNSAFDNMRELLYQHLTYNDTISISTSPIYYLEPNTMVYIRDDENNIIGDYVMQSFNIPLDYSSNMSITSHTALSRY